jgi:hypothetical protein
MSMPSSTVFAALVVLAGAPEDPRAATASNVDAVRATAQQYERAARAFEALGFRIGPMVGHGFSIEGDAAQFRSSFGVTLGYAADGSVRDTRHRDSPLRSLPLTKLPASLRSQVQSVLFSEPPAFGPGKPP